MTFTVGGLIQATDYNTLTQQGSPSIQDIFGTGFGDAGYGGNSTQVSLTDLPSKSLGQFVTNEDWQNFVNAWNDIAIHQGNFPLPDPLPGLSLLEDGDFISFFSQLENSSNVSAIDGANRFDVAESLTVAALGSSVRTTAWSSQIIHEFTVTFSSFDRARHFFNTGGSICVSASRSGGSSTDQNTAWTMLTSGNSPYIFDVDNYFALTASFPSSDGLTRRTVMSGGAYTSNVWRISVRRDDGPGPNGAAGSIIRFRSQFIDGHMGTGGGPDEVDGTFTSTIDSKRAVAVFPQPNPSFTTITPLTFGS